MNRDQILFFRIIKDYIRMEKTNIKEPISDSVINWVHKHQLAPIFYNQTRNEIFQEAYFAQVYQQVNIEYLWKKIRHAFGDIDYFMIKGLKVAQYYPSSRLRTMGDVDIVIKKTDKLKVDQILHNLGFQRICDHDREWKYTFSNSIILEVHDSIIYEDVFNTSKMINFFQNCWQYYGNHELDKNFHFIYLIFHLRKHLLKSGVGFRQFLDIAIICKNCDLDWEWIQRTLEQIELLDFAKNVLAFNERWFEVTSPIEIKLLEETFFQTATERVFRDGIFGFENIDNMSNISVNEYRKNGRVGILLRLKKDMFLPYEKMICMEDYKFLVNRKWLLPIAWIYRVFLKRNKRSIIKKNYLPSKQEIKQRNNLLQQWGL